MSFAARARRAARCNNDPGSGGDTHDRQSHAGNGACVCADPASIRLRRARPDCGVRQRWQDRAGRWPEYRASQSRPRYRDDCRHWCVAAENPRRGESTDQRGRAAAERGGIEGRILRAGDRRDEGRPGRSKEARPRRQAFRDRSEGQSARRDPDPRGGGRGGWRFDQSGGHALTGREPLRRHALDFHRQRQDAHGRRQARLRQGLAAQPRCVSRQTARPRC